MNLKFGRKRPKRLYALFANQRSGTHFLGALLRSNPAIFHFNEVFYPAFTEHKFFAFLRERIEADPENLLFTDPQILSGVLRAYFLHAASQRRHPVVGFDLKLDQAAAFACLPGVLRELDFKIVLLTRANAIDRAISYGVLRERLRRGAPSDHALHHAAQPAPVRVSLDPEQVLAEIRGAVSAEETVRRTFAGPDFFELRYEDLAATDGSAAPGTPLRRLGDFLGVGEFAPSKAPLPVKQNAWAHDEVVENWAELRAALLASEFVAMLPDSPRG